MKVKIAGVAMVIALVLVQLSVFPVFAVPPMPSGFYGNVTISGANVPIGTVVTAIINGVSYATFSVVLDTDSGYTVYALQVPGDQPETIGVIEGGVAGDTVKFYVGGLLADQTRPWVSGTNIPLNLTVTNPTAVTLESFESVHYMSAVRLNWVTTSELGLVGFDLYRSETLNGVRQKLNPNLLPAKNPGQIVKTYYQFMDQVVQGKTYFYWLEMIKLDATQEFSSLITTYYFVNIPVILK
jgi:hypothetical protein